VTRVAFVGLMRLIDVEKSGRANLVAVLIGLQFSRRCDPHRSLLPFNA